MRWVAGLVSAALLALPSPTVAKCLGDAEARSLVTAALPRMLAALAQSCSTSLPSDAALLDRASSRYRELLVAAEMAEPAGRSAASVFMSGGFFGSRGGEEDLEFSAVLLAASIGKDADERDCARIEEAWRLLEPLPPAELARLFALTLRGEPDAICKSEDGE